MLPPTATDEEFEELVSLLRSGGCGASPGCPEGAPEAATGRPSSYGPYQAVTPALVRSLWDEYGREDVPPSHFAPTSEQWVDAFTGLSAPSVTFWRNGGMMRTHIPNPTSAARSVGIERRSGSCLRGSILEFSRRSRMRMKELFASIDREAVPAGRVMMATFTYPGHWPENPLEWKEDMKSWRKRLEREYDQAEEGEFTVRGSWSVVWKLEFQRRGAPHFHVVILLPEWMDGRQKELKRWAKRAWFEVVGSGDRHHKRFGFWMDQARSWAGVGAYTTKYISKPCQAPVDYETGEIEGVGRFWGVWWGQNLPIATEQEELTGQQAVEVIRLTRRLAISRCKERLRRAIALKSKLPPGKWREAVNAARVALQRVCRRRLRRREGGNFREFLDYGAARKMVDWVRQAGRGVRAKGEGYGQERASAGGCEEGASIASGVAGRREGSSECDGGGCRRAGSGVGGRLAVVYDGSGGG